MAFDDEITTSRFTRLESDVRELTDEVDELKRQSIENGVRFENGRHVMGEMKEDIKAIKPKVPRIVEMIGVLAIILGGQLWLITQINTRPTAADVKTEILERTSVNSQQIEQLKRDQSELRGAVSNVERKLDVIIERLTPR